MRNKPAPPDRPYVYAFSTGRLVLLACMVLLLIALSLMLGIRIEKYQRSASLSLLEPVGEPARQAPVKAPSKSAGSLSKAEPAGVKPGGVAPQKAEARPEAEPAPKPKPEAPKPKTAKPVKAAPAEKQAASPAVATRPSKAAASPAEKVVRRGHYAVQVESSQDKAKAERQVELLKKRGFTSYLEEVNIEGKGRFFRVMVGPYESKAEARQARNALAKDSRFAGSYVRYLP